MSLSIRRKLTIAAVALTCAALFGHQTGAVRAAPLPVPAVELHVVQAGETLDSIATTFRVSPLRLAEVNHIDELTPLAVGDRLLIPHAPGYGDASSGKIYVVGLSDQLDVIAAQNNTTEQEIALANKIVHADMIAAGQTLSIPDSESASDMSNLAQIAPGSSLWQVALAANANIDAVAQANHLASTTDTDPGSFIHISAAQPPTNFLASPWVKVQLNAPPLEAGRSASLDITVDSPGTLTGTFLSRDIRFANAGNDYNTIIGIERWTKPGLYPLTLTFTDASGKANSLSRNVVINRGNYATEILKLSDEAAALRSDPQVVADELAYLTQKMSGFTPQRYWNGMFLLPTDGILTSAFGSVRSINGGGYDSYHAGNDLASMTGTPIYAPADGVVVDTGMLEVRGFSTIIDHGEGVYTGYWHQSAILVKPGDKVTAGQKIGVVGDTGSSTASHLHWEMWVDGVPVDSLQWVREVFP